MTNESEAMKVLAQERAYGNALAGTIGDGIWEQVARDAAASILRAVAAARVIATALEARGAEIARLGKALGLQMDEKHKEAAEARLWFTKAQEWRARIAELERALTDAGAHLAAAISLLERGGKAAKKAAPSDRMFDQMLTDYRNSLERTRSILTKGNTHD